MVRKSAPPSSRCVAKQCRLCRFPDYAARIKTNRPKALGIQGVLARQSFSMRHSQEARDQSCLRKASNSSSG